MDSVGEMTPINVPVQPPLSNAQEHFFEVDTAADHPDNSRPFDNRMEMT
jgi:hypothetical protein